MELADSYVTNGVWVSSEAPSEDVPLTLRLAVGDSALLDVVIHDPIVTVDLERGRGIIAGVLHVDELVDSVRGLVGAVDPSFCEGTAIEGVLNGVRQAVDLRVGAGDDTTPCDAISIGIGFDAIETSFAGTADPDEPLVGCGE